jgi:amidase
VQVDAYSTATQMLAALRDRAVSAVELLELHLRRIERYNPALNAVVVPNVDAARSAAVAADRARERGEDGALLGLPHTLKESINVRGLRTTAGVPESAQFVSAHDAPLAARARAAGGVLLGKTNVPPMLMDWQSDNPVFGRSNNPWDLGRTPGGSTGGGAGALAAGLTPLEYGSDIGGSIRVPAAFCGVFGHKPSETALPRSGQFPFPPMPNAAALMGVQGPLARGAEDLDLALAVAAGPDVGEDAAWRLALPPPRRARLADCRVAVLPPIGWLPVDDEIRAALDDLAHRLAAAGARVAEAQPEPFGDLRDHHRLYVSLLMAVTGARLPDAARRERLGWYAALEDEFAAAAVGGLQATVADFFRWHAERERYRAAYRAFFREWDVLLAPITLTPAFEHRGVRWPLTKGMLDWTVRVGATTVPYEWQLCYPGIATLSGQPATAFPVGLTRGGLPIGVQAIGPYLEDRTPIRVAALIAGELGGFTPPPGYRADPAVPPDR